MPCHQLFGVSVCRVASRDWGHIPCLLANTCFPRNGSENGPRPYFAACPILHTRHVSSKIVPVSWVFPIFPRHPEYKSGSLFFCFLAPYSFTQHPRLSLDPFQILHRFPKFTGVTLYPLWCPLPHQGQGLEARASHTRTTEFRREKLQSQDHLSNPHQPSAEICI